jgi:hypothetical protein
MSVESLSCVYALCFISRSLLFYILDSPSDSPVSFPSAKPHPAHSLPSRAQQVTARDRLISRAITMNTFEFYSYSSVPQKPPTLQDISLLPDRMFPTSTPPIVWRLHSPHDRCLRFTLLRRQMLLILACWDHVLFLHLRSFVFTGCDSKLSSM